MRSIKEIEQSIYNLRPPHDSHGRAARKYERQRRSLQIELRNHPDTRRAKLEIEQRSKEDFFRKTGTTREAARHDRGVMEILYNYIVVCPVCGQRAFLLLSGKLSDLKTYAVRYECGAHAWDSDAALLGHSNIEITDNMLVKAVLESKNV